MRRLRHWLRVVGALGQARALRLLRLPDVPHGWDGPDECEACGCSLAYVAEGWDRWRECTNTWCNLAPYEEYDYFADGLEEVR